MQYTAAIVGFGNSGKRFLAACSIVAVERSSLVVKCIVDSNRRSLEEADGSAVDMCTSVEEALDRGAYDVIFICANDSEHFGILKSIRRTRSKFQRIICEKPVVETLDQARQVASEFENELIAVNFNERFSPVVSWLRNWILQQELDVTRASFFWGKSRIRDPRPTIGILSEISHPVDLVLYLARVPVGTEFRVINATSISSDFANAAALIPDTVDLTVQFSQGLLVNGTSSYVWSARDRRVILYLGPSRRETTHLAVLTFDDPQWDVDQLQIFDLQRDPGCQECVKKITIADIDIPSPRRRINKICRLLECIVGELDGRRSVEIPRLDQGVYVQSVLDAIAIGAGLSVQWRGSFSRDLFSTSFHRASESVSLERR